MRLHQTPQWVLFSQYKNRPLVGQPNYYPNLQEISITKMRDVDYSKGANDGEHQKTHTLHSHRSFLHHRYANLQQIFETTHLYQTQQWVLFSTYKNRPPVGLPNYDPNLQEISITEMRDVDYSMGANAGEHQGNSHHALPSLFFTPQVCSSPADI